MQYILRVRVRIKFLCVKMQIVQVLTCVLTQIGKKFRVGVFLSRCWLLFDMKNTQKNTKFCLGIWFDNTVDIYNVFARFVDVFPQKIVTHCQYNLTLRFF